VLHGIDISQWQRRRFPFEKLDIDFCYIRCYGRGKGAPDIDPLYVHFQRRAKELNLLVGSYSALYGDIPIQTQVNKTYAALARGHGFEDQLPLALDVELAGIGFPMVRQWCERMLDLYETELVIYTAPAYWGRLTRIWSDAELGWIHDLGIKLWIAHWKAKEPDVVRPWKDWYVWQTDSSGSIDGIRYDRNVARDLP
jgi:GH25 family lysozyme M1 (1,4-beta-N-acetylmuramidase)